MNPYKVFYDVPPHWLKGIKYSWWLEDVVNANWSLWSRCRLVLMSPKDKYEFTGGILVLVVLPFIICAIPVVAYMSKYIVNAATKPASYMIHSPRIIERLIILQNLTK